MSEYYCDNCNRTIKLNYKMKHINTRLHRDLSMSAVNRFCFKKPTFLQIADILEKHLYDNNKRFGFFNYYK